VRCGTAQVRPAVERSLAIRVGAEELTQRLGAPEHAGRTAALDEDPVPVADEAVLLGAERGVELEPDAVVAGVVEFPPLVQRQTGGLLENGAQPVADTLRRGAGVELGARRQPHLAGTGDNTAGLGNQFGHVSP
jgi:hypothetical protein